MHPTDSCLSSHSVDRGAAVHASPSAAAGPRPGPAATLGLRAAVPPAAGPPAPLPGVSATPRPSPPASPAAGAAAAYRLWAPPLAATVDMLLQHAEAVSAAAAAPGLAPRDGRPLRGVGEDEAHPVGPQRRPAEGRDVDSLPGSDCVAVQQDMRRLPAPQGPSLEVRGRQEAPEGAGSALVIPILVIIPARQDLLGANSAVAPLGAAVVLVDEVDSPEPGTLLQGEPLEQLPVEKELAAAQRGVHDAPLEDGWRKGAANVVDAEAEEVRPHFRRPLAQAVVAALAVAALPKVGHGTGSAAGQVTERPNVTMSPLEAPLGSADDGSDPTARIHRDARGTDEAAVVEVLLLLLFR
mmetsp:Transcript_73904/g.233414  ORF Transcript_73904/g.233414 Transcript_73904/m.233414 type:complete len:353 (-) Transcript_73904:138-1196(-)